jgi:hypothetical protein
LVVGEVGPPAVGGEAPKPEPLLEPNPDPEFGPLFEPKPDPLLEPKPEPLFEPNPDPLLEPKPVPLLEPKPVPDAPFAPVLFDAPLRLVAAPAVASRALWLRSKTNSHWL